MAAAELGRAAQQASACAAANGQLEAAWKLLGDIGLSFHAISPLPGPSAPPSTATEAPAQAVLKGYVASLICLIWSDLLPTEADIQC